VVLAGDVQVVGDLRLGVREEDVAGGGEDRADFVPWVREGYF
jgi:hypothetical protein